jgi:hypothetical protein
MYEYHVPASQGEATNYGILKIDGRVVVDASAYFHDNPDENETLGNLDSDSIAPNLNIADEKHMDLSDDYGAISRCGLRRPRYRRSRRRGSIQNGEASEERERKHGK